MPCSLHCIKGNNKSIVYTLKELSGGDASELPQALVYLLSGTPATTSSYNYKGVYFLSAGKANSRPEGCRCDVLGIE